MLAQYSQFAAGERARYSFFVFRHATIQTVSHCQHRRIALNARRDQSCHRPQSRIIRRLDARSNKGLGYLQPFQLVAGEKIGR